MRFMYSVSNLMHCTEYCRICFIVIKRENIFANACVLHYMYKLQLCLQSCELSKYLSKALPKDM